MANCPKNHSKLVTRFFSTLCCTKVAGGDQEMTCTYFDGSMNHQNEVGPSSMRNVFCRCSFSASVSIHLHPSFDEVSGSHIPSNGRQGCVDTEAEKLHIQIILLH